MINNIAIDGPAGAGKSTAVSSGFPQGRQCEFLHLDRREPGSDPDL